MKRLPATLLTESVFPLFVLGGCGVFHGPVRNATGVNLLDAAELQQIDRRARETLVSYNYINLALVRDGQIVLTKSYGCDRLQKRDVYASVSKPVTAMILLQLLREGRINRLDDDIARYHDRYKDALPAEYADTPITFKQLLTHTSGVPHLSRLWGGRKLKLEFCPGTDCRYSSHGYGILGEVMEQITGKSYKQLVKDYIGKPIGAESFTVLLPFFDAPAGQVASTIGDMARFAVAVMDGRYIPTEMLQNEVLRQYTSNRHGAIGLGWYCTRIDTPDLAGYHAGSNGRPRAFLAIKPHKRSAIALTGLNRTEKNPHDFGQLTIDLMAILEHRQAGPNETR